MSSVFWSEHREPSDALTIGRAILDTSDADRPVEYTLIAELGSGSDGTTYTASTDRSEKPSYVIKEIYVRRDETGRQFTTRIKREYVIFNFIETVSSKGSQNFCDKYGICATSAFLTREAGYIVFPYQRGMDLQEYMLEKFYVTDNEWNIMNAEKKRAYRFTAMTIASQLCEAIHTLNTFGVYHGDIKPENVYVVFKDDDGETFSHVRMIDFGFSCVTGAESFLANFLQEEDLMTCALKDKPTKAVYGPDPFVRDPASGRGPRRGPGSLNKEFDIQLVPMLWPAFETYSCAITVQWLFDEAQNVSDPMMLAKTGGVPIIRRTRRYPVRVKLYDTLKEMVGPIANRKSLATYAKIFTGIAVTLKDD